MQLWSAGYMLVGWNNSTITVLMNCRYAFSGGRQTEKEQRELGADLSVDVPYKWLEFFLDDDAEFERIGTEYGTGRMLTGEVKGILINLLQNLVGRHQRARALVTSDVVRAFMEPRQMTNLWG
jgi:tryptophanyl-tRNA synthetase